jgi:hypothetical protein
MLLVVAALVLVAASAVQAQPDSLNEEALLRQIKTDIFEDRWEAVLEGCDQLIQRYHDSASLARTMYYRARALHHLDGRESEALVAYGEFIDGFPDETLLREDALISRMSLAKKLWLRGHKETIRLLMEGLSEEGYPRLYAAIQISHLDNMPARARALPVLKECSQNAEDAEVRNECTLGILRIDPSAMPTPSAPPVPAVPPAPGAPPAPPADPEGEPKLIRLQVREKVTGKITVAVNLPIAFAEALLASLSEFDQGRVVDEMKIQGIDINNLWKSLRTLGRQTLVEIETEEAFIKVWLE